MSSAARNLVSPGHSPAQVRRAFWPALSNGLSYAVLFGGLATIALAAYMVVVSYSSLPWSDGWIQIFVAAGREGPLSFSWFWHQHNEHRLLIPKLFLIADLRCFHARQMFLLASIFAIQLMHWMLLGWSMRVLGGWRGASWRSGWGLAAFCLFCPSQWENLVWGFQTCFVLPGLFASLAFVGLLLYWRSKQQSAAQHAWGFLLLSIAAALGATYSLANGNLLWPLLIATAWLLGLHRSTVASYATVGAVSTFLYFHHYSRPPQNSDPLASMRTPARLIEYVAVYFGSSWVRQSVHWAVLLGGAGVLLAILLLWRLRPLSHKQPFSIQLFATLGFCLGTALLTALGRVSSGMMQAFASRYQSIALLFWCCLGLLLVQTTAIVRSRLPGLLVPLALLAVLLRGAGLARFPIRDAREHAFQLHAAGDALITGVSDLEQITRAFPHPDPVVQVVPYMREHRLSIFSDTSSSMLGRRFDSEFQVEPGKEECEGEVQSVTTVSAIGLPALRIAGWSWNQKLRRPGSYVVVVSGGRIIGLGALGDWRPQIRAVHRELRNSFVGYTAYINEAPSAPLEIYAVFEGRPARACLTATLDLPVKK